MKRLLMFILILLSLVCAVGGWSSMATVQLQVGASLRDGRTLDGAVADSYAHTTGQVNLSGDTIWSLFGFTGATPPPGSTINSAYISLPIHNTAGRFYIIIHGELAANSAELDATTPELIENRSRTTANTGTINQVYSGTAGDYVQLTTDLSSIIQEIIDQPGWAGGNALALIAQSVTSAFYTAQIRWWDYAGNPGAILDIDYTPPATTTSTSTSTSTTTTTTETFSGIIGPLFRITLKGYNGSSEQILRFASRGHYDDDNNFYDDRILTSLSLERYCFKNGTTFGATEVGLGYIDLVNTDGGLDIYENWGFDGRDITVEYAAMDSSTFHTIWKGKIDHVDWTNDINTVRIKVRDRQQLFEKKLQQNLYTADDVGVNETDLVGTPKPIAVGSLKNVPLVLIDSALQIYQAHDGPMYGVNAVYHNGLALGQNLINNGDFNLGGEFWEHADASYWDTAFEDNKCALTNVYREIDQVISSLDIGGEYIFSMNIVYINTSVVGEEIFKMEILCWIGLPDAIAGIYIEYDDDVGQYSTQFTVPSSPCSVADFISISSLVDSSPSTEIHITDISITPVATDHATRADLENAVVPTGGYHTCLSEGLIRLGTETTGDVTADIEGGRNLSLNLMTNGEFESEDGWTIGDNWYIDTLDGSAHLIDPGLSTTTTEADTSNTLECTQFSVVAGNKYLILFDIYEQEEGGTSTTTTQEGGSSTVPLTGSITPEIGGVEGDPVSTTGGNAVEITASNAGNLKFNASLTWNGKIKRVLVYQIVTEATQPTSVPAISILLLLSHTELTIDDINTTDFDALEAQNSSEIAFFDPEGKYTILEALELIHGSVGSWFGFDRTQEKLTCGRIQPPTSSIKTIVVETDCIAGTFKKSPTQDGGKGIPPWKVTLKNRRNWLVQEDAGWMEEIYVGGDGGLSDTVSNTRRAFLRLEYRDEVVTVDAVLTKHLNAPEMEFISLLEENYGAEALRLMNLYAGDLASGVGMLRMFEVKIALSEIFDSVSGMELDIGSPVKLISSRLGLDYGIYCLVIGMEEVYHGGTSIGLVSLTLIGWEVLDGGTTSTTTVA